MIFIISNHVLIFILRDPIRTLEGHNDSINALATESSMPECEMTFDLENDTLVKKWNETSSWDETFEIDALSEVCEQAYNEILNDLIFEDIIYETL